MLITEGGRSRTLTSDISAAEGCRAIVESVIVTEGRIEIMDAILNQGADPKAHDDLHLEDGKSDRVGERMRRLREHDPRQLPERAFLG